jgi:hypothetical protein
MWRSKDKSRVWWFQKLPHGLQNHHRSCCRSRRRSCCQSRRRRIWGLLATLFYPGRRWRSPHSPQCAWTASSYVLRKKLCLSMAGFTGVRQIGPCARVQLPPLGRRRTDLFHVALRTTHGAVGWDSSSSSPRNLTLLAGAADSTEEDRRGHGCGPPPCGTSP